MFQGDRAASTSIAREKCARRVKRRRSLSRHPTTPPPPQSRRPNRPCRSPSSRHRTSDTTFSLSRPLHRIVTSRRYTPYRAARVTRSGWVNTVSGRNEDTRAADSRGLFHEKSDLPATPPRFRIIFVGADSRARRTDGTVAPRVAAAACV